MGSNITIRAATVEDLAAIAAIQQAAPEASQWKPEDYLGHRCIVAETAGEVTGFLVTRETAPGECEILNLAVDPRWRRLGIGRQLLDTVLQGEIFLEVRDSNGDARAFYENAGFRAVGRRRAYYSNPDEDAIVLRFYS